MPENIDRQREALLARRDQLLSLVEEPDHTELVEHELDELHAALDKLDEVTTLGDGRPHPRLKVRRVPEYVTELDLPYGHRWLVSERAAADDEVERVLGTAPDMPTAISSAALYVGVQRVLAERAGGTR